MAVQRVLLALVPALCHSLRTQRAVQVSAAANATVVGGCAECEDALYDPQAELACGRFRETGVLDLTPTIARNAKSNEMLATGKQGDLLVNNEVYKCCCAPSTGAGAPECELSPYKVKKTWAHLFHRADRHDCSMWRAGTHRWNDRALGAGQCLISSAVLKSWGQRNLANGSAPWAGNGTSRCKRCADANLDPATTPPCRPAQDTAESPVVPSVELTVDALSGFLAGRRAGRRHAELNMVRKLPVAVAPEGHDDKNLTLRKAVEPPVMAEGQNNATLRARFASLVPELARARREHFSAGTGDGDFAGLENFLVASLRVLIDDVAPFFDDDEGADAL